MSETPKIEPPLTPLEWDEALNWPHGVVDYLIRPAELVGYGKDAPNDLAALIALTNAALPDDDPRKITREKVAALRVAFLGFDGVDTEKHDTMDPALYDRLEHFIDALESYLPPEP